MSSGVDRRRLILETERYYIRISPFYVSPRPFPPVRTAGAGRPRRDGRLHDGLDEHIIVSLRGERDSNRLLDALSV